MYDYLVVGAGLYGAVFANQAKAQGKSVLVIDKRPNIAGNVFTEKIEGINVQKLKVFRFMNMGHIFSILIIRKFGILLIGLLNLTDLLIHR